MAIDPAKLFPQGRPTAAPQIDAARLFPTAESEAELREPPSRLDELGRGFSSGVDQLQMTGFGLIALAGRELGDLDIAGLEEFGLEGVTQQQLESAENPITVGSTADIETFDDFLRWAAGAVGNAAPSLLLAFSGGGAGAALAKGAIQSTIRKKFLKEAARDLINKGMTGAEASAAIEGLYGSAVGQKALLEAARAGLTSTEARALILKGGAKGAFAASAGPQIGGIDIELTEAGVDAGLTSLAGGIIGGALDALPVTRLMSKMFPGVGKTVSQTFVKDFAKGMGIQGMLEGGTEAAQEVVAMAALAYHDPSFDMLNPDNPQRIIDSLAMGALVGALTGGLGSAVGRANTRPRKEDKPEKKPKTRVPVEGVQGTLEGNEELVTLREELQQQEEQNELPENVRVLSGVEDTAVGTFGSEAKPDKDSPRTFTRDDDAKVVGTLEQAEALKDRLRERFPSARDENFVIAEQGDGFVVEVVGEGPEQTQALRLDEKIATSIEKAAKSARKNKNTDRQFSRPSPTGKGRQQLDMPTLMFAGLDLDPGPGNRNALAAFLGEAFTRGVIDLQGLNEALDAFDATQRDSTAPLPTKTQAELDFDALEPDLRSKVNERVQERLEEENSKGRTRQLRRPQLIEEELLKIESGAPDAVAPPSDLQRIERGGLVTERAEDTTTLLEDTPVPTAQQDFGDAGAFPNVDQRNLVQRQETIDTTPNIDDPLGQSNSPAQTEDTQARQAADTRNPKQRDLAPGVQRDEVRRRQRARLAKEEAASRKKKTAQKKAKQKARAKEEAESIPKELNSKVNDDNKIVVFMPGSDRNLVNAVKTLAARVAALLGPSSSGQKVSLRIVNAAALSNMINKGHLDSDLATDLLVSTPGAMSYDAKSGVTYVFVDDKFLNPAEYVAVLAHELGHLVNFNTWESLSDSDKNALWNAFNEDVRRGKRTTHNAPIVTKGDPNAKASTRTISTPINNLEFREWMADQFTVWMANRTEPKNALERFLETVATKLESLFEFFKANPLRFGAPLNETFGQYMDAVARRMRDNNAEGKLTPFSKEISGQAISLAELRGLKEAVRDMMILIEEANQMLADGEMSKVEHTEFVKQVNEQITMTRDSGVLGVVGKPSDVTQKQWTDLTKRVTEQYPAVVDSASRLATQMKQFYKMAIAPSTSVMRSLGKRVAAANKLVTIFNREEHGKKKVSANYAQRLEKVKGRFLTKFTAITKGMSDAEKLSMVKRLRVLDGTDKTPTTGRDAQIRRLFDEMHEYLLEAGLPVGKIQNYFPKVMSKELLIRDKDHVIRHIMSKNDLTLEKAQNFYNSLISLDADEGSVMQELKKYFQDNPDDPLLQERPGFKNMFSRTMDDKFFDTYLETNLDSIVSNYVIAGAKRAEFNRSLGSKARKGLVGGDTLNPRRKGLRPQDDFEPSPAPLWNSREKLEAILDEAREQGATDQELLDMKKYVDANLGMLGRDLPNGVRTAMAAIIAYQNMRVLLFTVFASLPDMVGPAIRSGSMRESFRSTMKNIKAISRDDDGRLNIMANSWGIISDAANQHILTEYVDNHFMPPRLRKWNETFFKYTGLNYYTETTRKMALATGLDYIQRMTGRVSDQSLSAKERAKAKAALAELGLSEQRVTQWTTDGQQIWGSPSYDHKGVNAKNDERVAEAMIQFVDESIMRPNASQRPMLASDPAFMLLYHLKGFIYAIHDVVIKRLAHNMRTADNSAQLMAAVAPAIMMFALTAFGLELRELVTGRDRTDKMDGWDYSWTLFERSGLMGITQLGFDFGAADARGQAELAALSGPAVGQLGDLISQPASQTIPKALPIVSQLPWARDALRGATPL